jgi:acetoin reductase-like protein
MRLSKKVAVVTGGSKGIGKAINLRLAREGADIVIADINLKEAEKTATKIQKIWSPCLAIKTDVIRSDDVDKMVEQVIKKFGRIDILVNNAGISSMAPIVDLEEKEWDANVNVNAKGQFLCSKAVAKHMINQRSGKIINNASLAAKRGALFLGHYSASKFAVLGLTYTMAIELAPYNITMNAVCPGIVETDMIKREWKWEGDLRGMTPEEVRKEVLSTIPLGRLAKPEDVAGVVAFLASEDADYITAQAININGGMESH